MFVSLTIWLRPLRRQITHAFQVLAPQLVPKGAQETGTEQIGPIDLNARNVLALGIKGEALLQVSIPQFESDYCGLALANHGRRGTLTVTDTG
jgi:hypothetical protein